MSFVLVSPSTLIALKLASAAAATIRRRSAASISASVMTNARSVAMFGWIIPAPFAMPWSRTTPAPRSSVTPIDLGLVSVVIIARAASFQLFSRSSISPKAFAMRSTGKGHPMTPVLATATS